MAAPDNVETKEYQPSQNGHSNGTRPREFASHGDMFIKDQKGQGNLARELMVWSQDPSVFLARTRITEKELAMEVRMLARYNAVHNGKADVPFLMWWKKGGAISINGEGRHEAVRMMSGMYEPPQGFGKRLMNRFQRMGGE